MVLAVDGVPPHIGANIVGRHDMPWHVVACRGTVRGTVRGMPWYPVTVPTACHKKKRQIMYSSTLVKRVSLDGSVERFIYFSGEAASRESNGETRVNRGVIPQVDSDRAIKRQCRGSMPDELCRDRRHCG